MERHVYSLKHGHWRKAWFDDGMWHVEEKTKYKLAQFQAQHELSLLFLASLLFHYYITHFIYSYTIWQRTANQKKQYMYNFEKTRNWNFYLKAFLNGRTSFIFISTSLQEILLCKALLSISQISALVCVFTCYLCTFCRLI